MRDVIVVGAGPAGSAVACHLARSGLDVLVLEKTSFPREKICGDGLTPRAVQELQTLGIDLTAPGWFPNRGIRLIGAGRSLEIDWPDGHGLTRTRTDFDDILARQATAGGAAVQQNTKRSRPFRDTPCRPGTLSRQRGRVAQG